MEEITQAVSDSSRVAESISTAYDSIWTGADIPTAPISGLDQVMLSNDKIFVVLAVLVTIWLGIIILILRNDRRIRTLERTLEDGIHDEDPFA